MKWWSVAGSMRLYGSDGMTVVTDSGGAEDSAGELNAWEDCGRAWEGCGAECCCS